MSRVPFTYTVIEPGVIIGSIPQLAVDFSTLYTDLHVRAIISMTRRDPTTYESMPQWFPSNLTWGHFPVSDGGIDDFQMRAAADMLNEVISNGNTPVYVHCRGGIGRSGTVLIAYYALHRGMSIEQARDMVRPRRNYEGNACAADQGSPQREWIDALK